jgi:hypothetical protein
MPASSSRPVPRQAISADMRSRLHGGATDEADAL